MKAPENAPVRRWPSAAAIAAIFLATIAAYWPVMRAGFIWDDDGHVTRPDLRAASGLARIWFRFDATQQYYPVLHSAFWIEHRLWGDRAWCYHLLNVLLHATAACLFARLLRRCRPDWPVGAWVAALCFALHPVEVESVAWISEQKNTLSAVLALLSALAYLRFDDTRSGRSSAGSAVLFALALLTKSAVAPLPAALLVVLWWRRGHLRWRGDVLPLLPGVVGAAAAGLITAWIERTLVGASGPDFALGAAGRVVLAGRALGFYLGRLLWPHPLIFVYPHWTIAPAALRSWLPAAAWVAAFAAAWSVRHRSRGPAALLALHAGLLFPALGFVNVYPFVFSYVADHFQYFASLAVLALAAPLTEAVRRAGSGAVRRTGCVVALGLAGLLAARTRAQAGIYRDSETLYRTTLTLNPDAWLAHVNLGVLLEQSGRPGEALVHYREALRLHPGSAQTENDLGNACAELGRWPEALAAYAEAVARRPQLTEAWVNWGNALAATGAGAAAEARYREALRRRPIYPEAEYRWGALLANRGELAAAAGHFQAALRGQPHFPEAAANLGLALTLLGRETEALPLLRAAVAEKPGFPEGHDYLAFACLRLGRREEARVQYQAALALNPADGEARTQLEQLGR